MSSQTGLTSSWQKRYPSTSPSARINTGLAFDKRNNVTVLFGGADFEFNTYDDTWTYSYDNNTWTDMIEAPTTSLPATSDPPLDWLPLVIAVPLAAILIALVWRRRMQ